MAALQENTLRVAPCKSTDEHVLFVAVVCYFLDKDRSYNTALFRAFVVSPLLVAGGLIAGGNMAVSEGGTRTMCKQIFPSALASKKLASLCVLY